MKLSRKLLILSTAVLIACSVRIQAQDQPSPESKNLKACKASLSTCKKWTGDATDTLKKVNKLLQQELERWTELHKNPIVDKVSVDFDDEKGEMYIKVIIDPRIKNAVNELPITRSYTFTLDKHPTMITGMDLMVGAAWMYKVDVRPFLGIGVRPFRGQKEGTMKDLGIGVYTMFYASGVMVYYSPFKLRPLLISAFVGYAHGLGGDTAAKTWTGGLGLGVRF